ncbi:MAG: hypothetical protein QM278_11930 [Pseudomonadota bacterium]|nr:hypothetical protein [Pseudomonadota bacterium]
MPIPYRDADELDDLGLAGYLKIQPRQDSSGFLAALLLINARGEPVEFTYNRIETPRAFLWRQADIRRQAIKRITVTLLSLCPKVPRFILCLAAEVSSDIFCAEHVKRLLRLLPPSSMRNRRRRRAQE